MLTRSAPSSSPPPGELRGGAWVVIDPTINEDMMEMYADKDSRGGILEPPGICEVKFRSADQIQAMHRSVHSQSWREGRPPPLPTSSLIVQPHPRWEV